MFFIYSFGYKYALEYDAMMIVNGELLVVQDELQVDQRVYIEVQEGKVTKFGTGRS